MADGKWIMADGRSSINHRPYAISHQPSAIARRRYRFGLAPLCTPHSSETWSIDATRTLARSSSSIFARSRSLSALCSFSVDRFSSVPVTRTCLPTSGSSTSFSPESRYARAASRICSRPTASPAAGALDPLVPTFVLEWFTSVSTYSLSRSPFCRQPVNVTGGRALPASAAASFVAVRVPFRSLQAADSTTANPQAATAPDITLRFIRTSILSRVRMKDCTACATDHSLQRRLRLRMQFTLMAREAADSAEARRPIVGFVVGEELLVDRFRHLEHAARDRFPRVRLAGEVSTRMTSAARRAERQRHALHLGFELGNRQAGQHVHRRRVDEHRRGGRL